ncbi:hypothetical protein ACIBSV_12195 [Embleya sp. NPDC050154]|uniref:hypothetical protein n=1 Tax=Embleya sp. NPDC050154 TaxID=3363988 RepID=UPI0037B9B4BF
MTDQPDDGDIEPTYWFCNSCGDEVDETDECCDDGEIEPSYDPPADPAPQP